MVSFCATSYFLLDALRHLVSFTAVSTSFMTVELALGEGFRYAWKSHEFALLGVLCLLTAVVFQQVVEFVKNLGCLRRLSCCGRRKSDDGKDSGEH